METFKQWLQTQSISHHINPMMKEYTTLHIGGTVPVMVEPSSVEELQNVLDQIQRRKIRFYILGNGSNVLFQDSGFNGVIIRMNSLFSKIELLSEDKIKVQAGATNQEVAQFTIENALTGYEFACGIPGTVGGAIVMNAGAYDGQMDMIVESATVLDLQGNIRILSFEDLDFAYRHSYFNHHSDILLDVTFQLKKGNQKDIQEKMNDFMKRRYDKQPMDQYSAGSTFKRPQGHYASKLIHEAGLQGLCVGDASVSRKHAGFLINQANATSQEFEQLIELVQEKVKEFSGVQLECEIKKVL